LNIFVEVLPKTEAIEAYRVSAIDDVINSDKELFKAKLLSISFETSHTLF